MGKNENIVLCKVKAMSLRAPLPLSLRGEAEATPKQSPGSNSRLTLRTSIQHLIMPRECSQTCPRESRGLSPRKRGRGDLK